MHNVQRRRPREETVENERQEKHIRASKQEQVRVRMIYFIANDPLIFAVPAAGEEVAPRPVEWREAQYVQTKGRKGMSVNNKESRRGKRVTH